MDIKLPPLGEGADSGVVVSVLVKPGDTISPGQPLLELENEKAIATIPAEHAGTVVEVYVRPGEKISVGQRILKLQTGTTAAGAGAATAPPAETRRRAAKPAPAAAPEPPEPEVEVEETPEAAVLAEEEEEEAPRPVAAPVAPPSVRRLARELGIDLSKVRGTDPGGRITRQDLRNYIQRLQSIAVKYKQVVSRQSTPAAAPATAPAGPPPAEPVDFAKWGPVRREPLTTLREVIARRMWESWSAIPHVTQFDEADFTRINQLRKQYGPAYEQKGVKLTVTPFIVRAVVDTLQKHPVFNSSLDEVARELVVKEYYHIGLAVDTEHGLLVPVLRDADRKSLLELAREIESLAQRARERKLAREEMQGGSFTISNQGAIGGAHFTPIVNRPEVAILGVGRGTLKPVVRDGQVVVRLMVPLAVSYDHRVIDGGGAARFIVDLVRALEEFPEEAVKL
ncbi:branched-chain alpha-keto acid dehydrogenase subunit E2 [Limisphaera ngatamarikiensis]|uniref:Dihydrolipoamide acetyltransferase component of pyruvate dehydrogenase complex n=1 Tax=Limisphaera ngatamarikiensis TaxID=1324935 RepID=A0A6M1RRL7_9BACT|nr:2-oxo acid dehydrogenase subunit E2 [Limisphaera ngatamarikiensis]NGO40047.1 branched-chain alpha-keto acid dehydrogenase subunit E2 [Limisphaera ngatamarikiensis]